MLKHEYAHQANGGGTCAQGKRAVRAEPQIWGRLKKVPDPVGFPMPGWELLDPESHGEP